MIKQCHKSINILQFFSHIKLSKSHLQTQPKHKCITTGISKQARKASIPNQASTKNNTITAQAKWSISHCSMTWPKATKQLLKEYKIYLRKNAHKTYSSDHYPILSWMSILLKKNACFGAFLYSTGSQHGNLHQLSLMISWMTCFILQVHGGTCVKHN